MVVKAEELNDVGVGNGVSSIAVVFEEGEAGDGEV